MDMSPGAEVWDTTAVPVEDASQVAAARRRAAELARLLDFDEASAGRVALAVTEVATNLLKHAGRGEMLLGVSRANGHGSVEVLALDRGPGMANVERSFEDGYSTAGSAGTGLGAVRRLTGALDVYSRPGGTALLMRIAAGRGGEAARLAPAVDGLSVALAGEALCGDAWDHEIHGGLSRILVVDGLGHGAGAAEAARECVGAFRRHAGTSPGARVEHLHAALRATRGAALAVAEIDPGRGVLRFAGVGNIAASIFGDGPVRHLVSNHGTAGHALRAISEYTYPWPSSGVLVMHSDGVATLRAIDGYPGLMRRDPGIIAGILYRDFARRRDDATVVVARGAAA